MQHTDEHEEKEEIDEEVEDEEFNDEEYEEGGERKVRAGSGATGRNVTLQMLLSAGVLQPGDGAMTIEYLGQKFTGDLLPDGKIKSQETDIVFASPSAWAIHCKRIINPVKKSGCGWASVRYRGRKLDAIKTSWCKKRKQDQNKENEVSDGVSVMCQHPSQSSAMGKDKKTAFNPRWLLEDQFKDWLDVCGRDPFSAKCRKCDRTFSLSNMGRQALLSHMKGAKHQSTVREQSLSNSETEASFLTFASTSGYQDEDMEKEGKLMMAPAPIQRMLVKHNVLGPRSIAHDPNTLVESTPFSTLGKIQPFLVSMSTNAVLVMDFHCHLTTSEVVGYLAGHWDVNAHNLAITHAFPCRSRLGDRELAPLVEADICRSIEHRHLTLVGWYHSHPHASATPTLRDIDAQLDYEIRMKGNSDASYTPCVGVICSPYNLDSPSLESSVVSYWVMPPPESKPHEYGKPMLMSYSVVQDQFLSQDALTEMKRCVDFYKNERDFVKFNDKYKGNITYLDKLKTTVTSKFPRDQSDGILWGFIRDLVCPNAGSSENGNRIFSAPDPPTSLNNNSSSAMDRVNLLVPNIPMPASSTPIKSPSGNSNTSNNLLLGSDIANALFASGKFPSPSSLMGLTPESARSVLNANNISNMFIPPMGFKMDNISILKPHSGGSSASSPMPSTSKASPILPPDVTATPVKPSPSETVSFTIPENLDKNCTMTSGHVM